MENVKSLGLKPNFSSIFNNTFKLWSRSLPFALVGGFFYAIATIGISISYSSFIIKKQVYLMIYKLYINEMFNLIHAINQSHIQWLVLIFSILLMWFVSTYFIVGLFNSLNAGDVPRFKYLSGYFKYLGRNIIFSILFILLISIILSILLIVLAFLRLIFFGAARISAAGTYILSIVYIIIVLVSMFYFIKFLLKWSIAGKLFIFDLRGFIYALQKSAQLTRGKLWMILGLIIVFNIGGPVLEEFMLRFNFYVYFVVMFLVSGLIIYNNFLIYYALRGAYLKRQEEKEESISAEEVDLQTDGHVIEDDQVVE
jgi:hypothetical protein